MTTREAFTPDEWTTVLAGPPTAGMLVITAASGGMFRETFAMSKAYAEATGKAGFATMSNNNTGGWQLTAQTVAHGGRTVVDNADGTYTAELDNDGIPRDRQSVTLVAGVRSRSARITGSTSFISSGLPMTSSGVPSSAI